MTVGIYGIFDSETDECLYVGMSKNIEERWRHHLKELRSKRHKRKDFVEWFHENGATAELLDFRILEECEKNDAALNLCEIKWFNKLLPKYYGKKPSENERWEQSEAARAKSSATYKEKYAHLYEFIEGQVEEVLKLASDPGITMKEAAQVLDVNYAVFRRFVQRKEIEWIFETPLKIRIDQHQNVLDAYFNEKTTTRDLAKRYGTTQKTVIAVFDLYRETDPRFQDTKMRQGLDRTKQIKSARAQKGIPKVVGKKECQYCQNLIGLNNIKRHEVSCKDWNECLVCGVRPKKRTATHCLKHKVRGKNKRTEIGLDK